MISIHGASTRRVFGPRANQNTIRIALRLFVIALLFAGCVKAPHDTPEIQAFIAGRIVGGDQTEVRISVGPSHISDGWSQPADPDVLVVPVQGDGSFEISVDAPAPGFCRLFISGETVEVLLQANETSHIEINSEHTDRGEVEIEFSLANAAENQFMRELSSMLGELERKIEDVFVDLFSLDRRDFLAQLGIMGEDLVTRHRAFLDDHNETPSVFVDRTSADIDSLFKTLELLYPTIHLEVTGHPADIEPGYFDELGRGSFDQPALLSSSNYIRFLDTYVDIASAGNLKFQSRNLPREKIVSRYQAIQDLPAHPKIKNYLLDQMFLTFHTNYGPDDWSPVLTLLREIDPDSPVVGRATRIQEEDLARRARPDEVRVFREVDGASLEAHIYYPIDYHHAENHSAYLFFHGGGWAIGTPEWGHETCKRMAKKGMVAISFEYRIADVHGTGILTAIDDVRSAIDWTREQARRDPDRLRIDPNKIVAAGFSAGGHLAAAAAILENPSGSTVDSIPNAIVVQSASYDLTTGSFFYSMTDGRPEAASLSHHVRPDLVPALLIHATYDHLTPIEEFQNFVDQMQALNNDFEYRIFDGVGHFFRDDDVRTEVDLLIEDFLVRGGFLDPPQGPQREPGQTSPTMVRQ